MRPEFLPTDHLRKNLVGCVFTRLTVLGYIGQRDNSSASLYWCRCECGVEKAVAGRDLIRGEAKSCFCLALETRIHSGEYRGDSVSPEMRAFQSAKTRCTNPKAAGFKDYGGRGVKFRFESFEQFLAEMGRKPSSEYSLERVDVNGHYEQGNVKWATDKEQARNKRNNILLTYKGQTKTQAEWTETYPQLRWRSHRGWCLECAIENPKGVSCKHRRVDALIEVLKEK